MARGRNTCNYLKAVRKSIAEENDIPMETRECSYRGECRGTCPQCEAEVQYLENALRERIRLGKVATVAGLALGLATTAHAQAPVTDSVPLPDTSATHKAECCGTLKGTVVDIKTNELLPFCNVELLQDGKQLFRKATDFDGMYTIRAIPFGNYTLRISMSGISTFEREISINKVGFTVMDVSVTYASVEPVEVKGPPVIEIGVPASSVEEIVRQVGGEDGRVNVPKEAIGEIQVQLLGTPASQATPKEQPEFYKDEQLKVRE